LIGPESAQQKLAGELQREKEHHRTQAGDDADGHAED
jgi:hypothetical protein